MNNKTPVDNDRCPHCGTFTTREENQLFYSAADGTFCLQCGGQVDFTSNGKAVKHSFPCIHGHLHRTQASHDRCIDAKFPAPARRSMA